MKEVKSAFLPFSQQLTLYLGKRDYVDDVNVVEKVGTSLHQRLWLHRNNVN